MKSDQIVMAFALFVVTSTLVLLWGLHNENTFDIFLGAGGVIASLILSVVAICRDT